MAFTNTTIRLWDNLGSACCDHFVGGFAFGVFDKKNKNLTISKNFKTLWYVLTDDYFMFASERSSFLNDGFDVFAKQQPRVFPMNTTLQLDMSGNRDTKTIRRQFWSSTPDLDSGKAAVVVSGVLTLSLQLI